MRRFQLKELILLIKMTVLQLVNFKIHKEKVKFIREQIEEVDMNYTDLIIAFEQWLETNYLQNDAQLLWYKLIALFNKANWCEWISVDNHRLMAKMQITRESTFIGIRDKLIEMHFFEYRKGKKGQPNRYRICTDNFGSINSSINRSKNSSINRSKNRRHIYITLHKII